MFASLFDERSGAYRQSVQHARNGGGLRVPGTVRAARGGPGPGGVAVAQRTAFMMVPALVATMPPIMAPATIFGEASPLPDHFSQANRPPA